MLVVNGCVYGFFEGLERLQLGVGQKRLDPVRSEFRIGLPACVSINVIAPIHKHSPTIAQDKDKMFLP